MAEDGVRRRRAIYVPRVCVSSCMRSVYARDWTPPRQKAIVRIVEPTVILLFT